MLHTTLVLSIVLSFCLLNRNFPPGNLLISLTWYSPPISSPAAHLLISVFVFIPVHFHLFPARLSCVFCQAIPRLCPCYCLITLFWPCLPVHWISDTLPAPLQICLLVWLISRFWPSLPVHRFLNTLPAPCRIVCLPDWSPGFDSAWTIPSKLYFLYPLSVCCPASGFQSVCTWKRYTLRLFYCFDAK